MKKNILLFMLAATGLLLARCASNNGSDTEKKDDYAATTNSADSLCLVSPSWFPHTQTPAPAEGAGSPFDVSSTTNQIFHQWAWNKFLWLTKPDANGTPLFLTDPGIQQVTTFMAPVKPPSGTMVVLQDIHQAGGGSPVLQTNGAYGSKSDTVYYSIYMNDSMYLSAVKLGKNVTKESAFPVGSFELKVAWVPVTAISASKLANYYTTMAWLSPDSGATYTQIKVALIGMHVVGVVENHPEFIWATFEHEDLSPDYDWAAKSATAAADMLVFKQGSVTGIDGIRYNTATMLGTVPYQVFDLFQYGVPRDSTGGFMATSQQEPMNFNNVDGINKCVHGQLNDVWNNYFYNGSIWLNMDGLTTQQQAQLIDSLGNSIGSATPGSAARGSLNCANVTMESFTQTFQPNINSINVTNLANCFSCHKGKSFDGNLAPVYLSHTFQDYLGTLKGNTKKQVESLKAKDEQMIMQRLAK
jgi:hypothetical protein